MASTRCKQRGAYYTPEPIARHIVGLTLEPLLTEAYLKQQQALRVIDPACGDGIFLLEAAKRLAETHSQPLDVQQRSELVQRSIFGIDIDQQAVDEAKERLAEWIAAGASESPSVAPQVPRKAIKSLERNIVQGDALIDTTEPAAQRVVSAAAGVDLLAMFGFERFDAVVGNPPYINIRLASQVFDRSLRNYYAARYQSARRAYDLYVLFLERGCELLKSGGRYGWIVPNKLTGAGYAEACRTMLTRQTTLDRWEDLSQVRVFAEAGVYPHIIVGANRPPSSVQRVETVKWNRATGLDCLTKASSREVMTIPLSSLANSRWSSSVGFEVENRIATIPLGELAALHSGATGFQAQQLAAELREAKGDASDDDSFAFITSGNIDRYLIDQRGVRFMKRQFEQARLAKDCHLLTENKRRLYGSPKLVIAGMTRRLEVAYDQQGRGLGVQVYAALDFECDPYYLLGILNSRLMSHLFHQRFSAKQLSGGYLSINKAQLVQLPIVEPGVAGAWASKIASTARRLEQTNQASSKAASTQVFLLEDKLDQQVFELYRIGKEEIRELKHSAAWAA